MELHYTKEPWFRAYRENGAGMYSLDIFDSNGETIAEMAWFPVKGGNKTYTNREENARRIVACVNACKNISTEDLENYCQNIDEINMDKHKEYNDNVSGYHRIGNLGIGKDGACVSLDWNVLDRHYDENINLYIKEK